MINASETSAATAAAAAATASAGGTEVAPEVFAGELAAAMTEAAKAVDKMAAALEKLAAAFPGTTITTRFETGENEFTNQKAGSGDGGNSIAISPAMMEQIATDEGTFDKLKEMLSMLFEAGSRQNLVNAGGSSVQRSVNVDSMQIRYVEVQRGPNGAQLSASTFTLENEQMVGDTLDQLLSGRNESRTSSSQGTRFQDLIGGSNNWRFQSILSMQSYQSASASWGGAMFQSQTLQSLQNIQSFSARLEVTIEQWTQAGGSSGADFMAYIEAMGLCDPLVLDLGGEGISLTSAEDGVYFDIKGDGSPVQTAFIKGDNAFLYLDENGNGVVDDVKELFGDYGGFANGFEKLSRYDDNGDAVIDERDAVYNQLRVWRDLNGDGVNQDGESMSLADAGVKSIDLDYQRTYQFDEYGNVIGERSSFMRNDGSQGMVADVWLRNR